MGGSLYFWCHRCKAPKRIYRQMNFKEFKDPDQHLSSYRQDFRPDVEAGLRRLHERLGADAGAGPRGEARVRTLPRRNWLAAAAAVLLLLTAGFLLVDDGATELYNNRSQPLAVSLPDGSRAVLQQGTRLIYPADYNDSDRRIELAGQAFFEIYSDAARPFLVTTSETELRVTGTAFNLRVVDDELEVEVSEGSVTLRRQDVVTPVGANRCGASVPGRACTVTDAPHLNRHAWRTGVLQFKATPLPAAVRTIGRNYGLDVTVPAGCDYPVSGTFRNERPQDVLAAIAELGGGELRAVDAVTYRLDLDCR